MCNDINVCMCLANDMCVILMCVMILLILLILMINDYCM